MQVLIKPTNQHGEAGLAEWLDVRLRIDRPNPVGSTFTIFHLIFQSSLPQFSQPSLVQKMSLKPNISFHFLKLSKCTTKSIKPMAYDMPDTITKQCLELPMHKCVDLVIHPTPFRTEEDLSLCDTMTPRQVSITHPQGCSSDC